MLASVDGCEIYELAVSDGSDVNAGGKAIGCSGVVLGLFLGCFWVCSGFVLGLVLGFVLGLFWVCSWVVLGFVRGCHFVHCTSTHVFFFFLV